MVEYIGEGSYGKVFKYNDYNGKLVAIKCIPKEHFSVSEVIVLKNIQHENLIKLLDVKSDHYFIKGLRDRENLEFKLDLFSKKYIYLILEYQFTELSLRVFQNLKDKKKILYQLLNVVNEIHNHNYLIGDIGVSNVLLDNENNVKLIDFSLASSFDAIRKLPDTYRYGYKPPELFEREQKGNTKMDIFNLGILFYYLFTGKYLHQDQDLKNCINYIYKYNNLTRLTRNSYVEELCFIKSSVENIELLGHYLYYIIYFNDPLYRKKFFERIEDKDLREIIEAMTQFDPEKRASFDEIMKMKYFEEYYIKSFVRKILYKKSEQSIDNKFFSLTDDEVLKINMLFHLKEFVELNEENYKLLELNNWNI